MSDYRPEQENPNHEDRKPNVGYGVGRDQYQFPGTYDRGTFNITTVNPSPTLPLPSKKTATRMVGCAGGIVLLVAMVMGIAVYFVLTTVGIVTGPGAVKFYIVDDLGPQGSDQVTIILTEQGSFVPKKILNLTVDKNNPHLRQEVSLQPGTYTYKLNASTNVSQGQGTITVAEGRQFEIVRDYSSVFSSFSLQQKT